MKKLCIVGCSITAAEETVDEDIIDDYWNFSEEEDNKNKFNLFSKQSEIIEKIYNNNMEEYYIDCLKNSWATLLKNEIKDKYETKIHAIGGSGIAFWQFVYNHPNFETHNNHMKTVFNKNFDGDIINDDLLIWQITSEPRMLLVIDDNLIIATELNQVRRILENNGLKISKWKKKLLIDYYENMFEENIFLLNKMNFFDMVINKRISMKKPTIIVSFFPCEILKCGYKFIENKYVHLIGIHDKYGAIQNFCNEVPPNKKAYCRFHHPSKYLQKVMAKYMNKKLKGFNLL